MIIMKTQSDYNHPVEVIGFVKGWQQATVVTDGKDTRSFTPEACTPHRDVKSAIAHLEAEGYHIIPDMSW